MLSASSERPAELKFVLVDPKKVEFSIYSVIEHHFLAKLPDGEDAIITDVTKVCLLYTSQVIVLFGKNTGQVHAEYFVSFLCYECFEGFISRHPCFPNAKR